MKKIAVILTLMAGLTPSLVIAKTQPSKASLEQQTREIDKHLKLSLIELVNLMTQTSKRVIESESQFKNSKNSDTDKNIVATLFYEQLRAERAAMQEIDRNLNEYS